MAVQDRSNLHNLASIESLILHYRTQDPKVYLAIHNLANVVNVLIDYSVPQIPFPIFSESFYVETPATGIIPISYQVKLPLLDDWTCTGIKLAQIISTVNAAVSGSSVNFDILVSQNKGVTSFKSILKSASSIPVGLTTTKNVKLAIDTFSDGDLLEFNITQIDSGGAGVGLEITLQGSYILVPK